jgi:hypothetical protein
MEKWTASEKLTYGPAFAAISYSHSSTASVTTSHPSTFSDSYQYGSTTPRRPTSLRIFVSSIVNVVSNGRHTFSGPSLFGINLGTTLNTTLGLGTLHNWWRGDHFTIGAGAQTYRLAALLLPSIILDTLLAIPHWMIGIRNKLVVGGAPRAVPVVPVPPTAKTRPSATASASGSAAKRRLAIEDERRSAESGSGSGEHSEASGSEADADVESNSGELGGGDSWVSLKKEGVTVDLGDSVESINSA